MLFQPLRREYHVLLSRLRLATPSGMYSYADIALVQGKLELMPRIRDTVTNPVLLIEIPSEWTDEFDRGKKFDHYSTIPSLRDYVLINQYAVDVEHRWRGVDRWQTAHYKRGESLAFTGIPLTIAVDALYEDVTIPA